MGWWKRIVKLFGRFSRKRRRLLDELVNHIREGQNDEALWMINDDSIRAYDDNHCLLICAALVGNAMVTRQLINFGYEVNVVYEHLGETPLTMAVIAGHTATVKVLLEANADIYMNNADGQNALQMVFNHYMDSGTELIKLFISRLEMEAMGPEQLVDKLVAEGCNLYCAIYFGDVQVVRCMLQRGFDINTRNPHGRTALHFAAEHNAAELAELLIGHGASVNVLDDGGSSPLMNAAQKFNRDIMKLLLEAGADPNTKARFLNWTPASCIFRARSNVPREQTDECLELLLQHRVVFNDWGSFLEDLIYLRGDRKKINMLMNYLAIDKDLNRPVVESLSLEGLTGYSQLLLLSQECLAYRISGDSTLLDLLTDSEDQMKNHARNKDLAPKLQRFLSNQQNQRIFPYYCSTLTKRLSKAERAVELEETAISFISHVMDGNVNLCYIAARKIISYLSENDLENLDIISNST